MGEAWRRMRELECACKLKLSGQASGPSLWAKPLGQASGPSRWAKPLGQAAGPSRSVRLWAGARAAFSPPHPGGPPLKTAGAEYDRR